MTTCACARKTPPPAPGAWQAAGVRYGVQTPLRTANLTRASPHDPRRPSPIDRRAVVADATRAGQALRGGVEQARHELGLITTAGPGRQVWPCGVTMPGRPAPLELADKGIRLNFVSPGRVMTPMMADTLEADNPREARPHAASAAPGDDL